MARRYSDYLVRADGRIIAGPYSKPHVYREKIRAEEEIERWLWVVPLTPEEARRRVDRQSRMAARVEQ